LRRLIGWLRQERATQIGLYGISLGGYTCSVLAGLEDGLECVIAGVPSSDVLHTGAYLASSIERRVPAAAGMDIQRDRKLLSVVSPFSFEPRISHERRFIYAATADQFVPIEQISALWHY
jgi:dipeptidyl aminopeptidase/acylaminoacyl peptidase